MIISYSLPAQPPIFGMDRVRQAAFTLRTIPDALEIRSTLLQNFERAVSEEGDIRKEELNIVIIGGGPTGMEMAGAIAELRANEIKKDFPDLDTHRIQIWLAEMATELIPAMSDHASEKSLEYLTELGVNVLLETAIKDYQEGKVLLSKGQEIPTNILIYAAGVSGTAPQGLPEAEWVRGHRLKVDEYCRVRPYQNIFAIGDLAAMEPEKGLTLPMLAQPAIQQGKFLARYFKSGFDAHFKGFTYKDLGTMATIGKRKAVADLKIGHFHGTFAWLIWLFVHVMGLVSFRNKLSVIFSWSISYFAAHKNYRLIIRPSSKLT